MSGKSFIAYCPIIVNTESRPMKPPALAKDQKNYVHYPTIGDKAREEAHKHQEYTECYWCAEPLQEPTVLVKRAIKKSGNARWRIVGRCCATCANERKLFIDPWS